MSGNGTLAEDGRAELEALARAEAAHAALHPGDRIGRQPVHTVYGGAHLYKAESAQRLGELARASLERHAPDPATLAHAIGLDDPALAERVYARVVAKLEREPVEDQRIDFEDGFGVRSDVEEDEQASRTAREVARAMKDDRLPRSIGIRIKPLTIESAPRAVRTLELFVSTLVAEAGALPPGFVVTLPKIAIPEQPRTLVRLFEALERRLSLPAGALRMEMMVELPQAIVAADGRHQLPILLAACEGRCTGAHFGTYDFTAGADVTAACQTMDHPIAEAGLVAMRLALSGRGVFLSDGATTQMPVGSTDSVHAAWRVMVRNVRRSLALGFYQGWDLHPAQLVARYAATGQGLLNTMLRGAESGAFDEAELAAAGLTLAEVRTRSFTQILSGRREQGTR